jgi:hypothetical protein
MAVSLKCKIIEYHVMKKYYVSTQKQSNGDYEVHSEDCRYLPKLINRIHIGIHSNCADALTEAKKIYQHSNGCKTCSTACHTAKRIHILSFLL